MSTNPHQLFLLADHVKLSLLERQRAISLNLEPTKQDSQITRSLKTLREGIDSLERQRFDDEAAGTDITALNDSITRLQSQYTELSSQFKTDSKPTTTTLSPNDPDLRSDFAAARSRSSLRNKPKTPSAQANKSVRFHDNAADDDDATDASRAALFSKPYTDDPDPEGEAQDQSALSNTQIHAYHKQVLRDQDDQLDVLGQSIGRQRDLSIQMGSELDEQAVMIDEVDQGVDRTQIGLDRGNARIKTISRKAKDNWSWVTIAILIIILVLLIVLIN